MINNHEPARGNLRVGGRSLTSGSSKQDLFLLVVEGWLHRIRELGLRATFDKKTYVEKVHSYLRPGITEANRASAQFLRDLTSYKAARNALDMHQHERSVMLENIIKDGIEAGEFRAVNIPLVAKLFIVCVGQLSDTELLDQTNLTFSEAMAEVFELVLHGIEGRR